MWRRRRKGGWWRGGGTEECWWGEDEDKGGLWATETPAGIIVSSQGVTMGLTVLPTPPKSFIKQSTFHCEPLKPTSNGFILPALSTETSHFISGDLHLLINLFGSMYLLKIGLISPRQPEHLKCEEGLKKKLLMMCWCGIGRGVGLGVKTGLTIHVRPCICKETRINHQRFGRGP